MLNLFGLKKTIKFLLIYPIISISNQQPAGSIFRTGRVEHTAQFQDIGTEGLRLKLRLTEAKGTDQVGSQQGIARSQASG